MEDFGIHLQGQTLYYQNNCVLVSLTRGCHVVHLVGIDNNVVPRFISRYLQQSISYRGAVLWNATTSKKSDIASQPDRTALD